MKKKFLFLLLAISINGFSQIINPVKWTTAVKKISASEYELIASASINGNWHLYSQNVPKDGPVPTSFTYESDENYLKKGNTNEDAGHTVNDPVFKMKITYFKGKAVFKQRIKLKKANSKFKVNAVVEYMVCNSTQCLPPKEVDLVFDIK